MEKSALLVIDMQIGAVKLENPKFYKIDELIVRLKGLIERARKQKLPIIYAQHHNQEGFLSYGSDEWGLIPEIGPKQEDLIIHKSTPDIFLNTPLYEELQNKGIKNLVICGIQTADCVDTSCRIAFSLGYKVVLVKNGHTTFDSSILKAEQIIEHHNHIIGTWFGKVIDAESINFK